MPSAVCRLPAFFPSYRPGMQARIITALVSGIAMAALAGCADYTPPPLGINHPASPGAQEGAMPEASHTLDVPAVKTSATKTSAGAAGGGGE